VVAIAPFRALRYDPTRVRLSRVTSPPHDVVSDAEQAAFRAQDAHSIMHVIQPEAHDGDAAFPDSPNKYERAAAALAAWQAESVLARDTRPAFYLYEVTHGGAAPPEPARPAARPSQPAPGAAPAEPARPAARPSQPAPGAAPAEPARRTMRGFFARIRLDPTYTDIRRHERTLAGKKKDRLHLRTATECDTESIWLLYRDERGWVDEILTSNAFEECTRFTDEHGDEHALLRVDRPEAAGEIVAQFEDRIVVIADGHHRYQTALDHHAATGRDEDASILVCLVRDTDPGLRIEPTHRLVVGLDLTPDEALRRAREHWEVEPWPAPGETGGRARDEAPDGAAIRAWVDADPRRCVVLAGDKTFRLSLRDGHEVDEARGRLDALVVTRVHERLLRQWGIGPDDVETHLRFTRSADDAVAAARDGRAQFVVMLSGEAVASVLDVAAAGHVMPQKATYFVPKLRSGVVLGPLDEAPPVPWRESAEQAA
jgi:uncharacterized protein (DUF1015 family)